MQIITNTINIAPREFEDIRRITRYITDGNGKQIPGMSISESEKALVRINTCCPPRIVQLPNGERGVFMYLQFPHLEADGEEAGLSDIWGIKREAEAWESLVSLATKLKNRGFSVFIGRKTGLSKYHEIGVFISYREFRFNSVMEVDEIYRKHCLRL